MSKNTKVRNTPKTKVSIKKIIVKHKIKKHPQAVCFSGKETFFTKTNVIPPAIIIPKRKPRSGGIIQIITIEFPLDRYSIRHQRKYPPKLSYFDNFIQKIFSDLIFGKQSGLTVY